MMIAAAYEEGLTHGDHGEKWQQRGHDHNNDHR
jgi:hypothetical protein